MQNNNTIKNGGMSRLKLLAVTLILSMAGCDIDVDRWRVWIWPPESRFIRDLHHWGRGDPAYDREIINKIVFSFSVNMSPEVFNAILRRIDEDPSLLDQFWLVLRGEEYDDPSETEEPDFLGNVEPWLVARTIRNLQRCRDHLGCYEFYLLVVSSMCQRHDWLAGVTMHNLESRTKEVDRWLSENAYYMRYDARQEFFVVDDDYRWC